MWFLYSELRLLPTLICMQTGYTLICQIQQITESNSYVHIQMCGTLLVFTSLDFVGGMAFSSPRFHKSFIHPRNYTGFCPVTGMTVLGIEF